MIRTCREGLGACCSTADKRNERGMKTSTLFNTTRDNWAPARRAWHKCTALLRKHKLCASYRLGSLLQHLELEIREQLISIGGVKHAC